MSHHTFTKIDHHRAVVIAGVTGWMPLNDTYVLDMQTWVWNNTMCMSTFLVTLVMRQAYIH